MRQLASTYCEVLGNQSEGLCKLHGQSLTAQEPAQGRTCAKLGRCLGSDSHVRLMSDLIAGSMSSGSSMRWLAKPTAPTT